MIRRTVVDCEEVTRDFSFGSASAQTMLPSRTVRGLMPLHIYAVRFPGLILERNHEHE